MKCYHIPSSKKKIQVINIWSWCTNKSNYPWFAEKSTCLNNIYVSKYNPPETKMISSNLSDHFEQVMRIFGSDSEDLT